jgi:hypothetical protein
MLAELVTAEDSVSKEVRDEHAAALKAEFGEERYLQLVKEAAASKPGGNSLMARLRAGTRY